MKKIFKRNFGGYLKEVFIGGSNKDFVVLLTIFAMDAEGETQYTTQFGLGGGSWLNRETHCCHEYDCCGNWYGHAYWVPIAFGFGKLVERMARNV